MEWDTTGPKTHAARVQNELMHCQQKRGASGATTHLGLVARRHPTAARRAAPCKIQIPK